MAHQHHYITVLSVATCRYFTSTDNNWLGRPILC